MNTLIVSKLLVLAVLLTLQGWAPLVTSHAAMDIAAGQSFDTTRATLEVIGPKSEDSGEPAAATSHPDFAARAPVAVAPPSRPPETRIRPSAMGPPVRAPPVC